MLRRDITMMHVHVHVIPVGAVVRGIWDKQHTPRMVREDVVLQLTPQPIDVPSVDAIVNELAWAAATSPSSSAGTSSSSAPTQQQEQTHAHVPVHADPEQPIAAQA